MRLLTGPPPPSPESVSLLTGPPSPESLSLLTGPPSPDSLSLLTGPPSPESLPEDGKLKSEVMVKDNRRYYLDLKENQRGRFLRVSIQFLFTHCVMLIPCQINKHFHSPPQILLKFGTVGDIV